MPLDDTSTSTQTPAPPKPAGGTPLSSVLAEQGSPTTAQGILGELGKTQKSIREEIAKLPQPPHLSAEEYKHLFSPPPVKYNNPYEGWGAVASQLAVLGSAFTRRPLINALNAASAGLNAMKQSDADAAKQQLDVWKSNRDLALKVMEFERQAYKDGFDMLKEKGREAEANAHLALTAAQLGDTHARLILETQGAHALQQYREQEIDLRRQELLLQGGKLAPIADATHSLLQANAALRKAQQSGDPAAIAKATDDRNFAIQNAKDIHLAEKGTENTGGGLDASILAQRDKERQAKGLPPLTADERTKALAEIRASERPPSASQIRDEEKAGEVAAVLDLGSDTVSMIDGSLLSVGAGGRFIGRPTEVLGNILKMTDDTTRKQIESNITTLRNTMLRLLNDRSILTARDHGDAEKIIRGLELGSTVQNTRDSIQQMQTLVGRKYREALKRHGFLDENAPPGTAETGEAPPAGKPDFTYDAQGNRVSK